MNKKYFVIILSLIAILHSAELSPEKDLAVRIVKHELNAEPFIFGFWIGFTAPIISQIAVPLDFYANNYPVPAEIDLKGYDINLFAKEYNKAKKKSSASSAFKGTMLGSALIILIVVVSIAADEIGS